MTNVFFKTSGDGLWGTAQKTVEITDIQLGYVNEEGDFGELLVFFNTDTWDTSELGLIYTDGRFLEDLQTFLQQHGLCANVGYSEQGMQSDDYVSLDVEGDFITAWDAKFKTGRRYGEYA